MFENQSIGIPCPKCGKQHAKTVGWLKSNRKLACTCGADINLDTSGLFRELKKVERTLADFPRKITIKL